MKRPYLLLLSLCWFAHNTLAENFSWHGYLSQGLTQSIDSQFITDSNDITGQLTELGINGRYDISPRLAVVGQVDYLNGGNRYESGVRLDYLFVDWNPAVIDNWDTHIHIGRFKNRHWLYSATRDVPQTRNMAVLPQSVYFDGFRDIALGSDGVLVQLTKAGLGGNWEVNWSLGRSPISDAQTEAFLGKQAKGTTQQNFVHQASVFWQSPSTSWRIGGSVLDSDFSYSEASVDELVDGDTSIQRLMLALQYFGESWEMSAELLREYQEDNGAFSADYYNKRIGEGGYIQGRYLFTSAFSGILGFDSYIYNRDDASGHELEASSGGVIPSYFGYMNTITTGFRWDIAPAWRLQGEYHWVHGASRVTGFLNPQTLDHTKSHWRMWSVQLMYWF